jgi:hypothetical protein
MWVPQWHCLRTRWPRASLQLKASVCTVWCISQICHAVSTVRIADLQVRRRRRRGRRRNHKNALYGLNWSEYKLRLAVQLVLPATVRSSTSNPPVLQLTSHQEQFTLTYQWRLQSLYVVYLGVFAHLMSLKRCFLTYAGAPAHVRYRMLSLIVVTGTPIVSEYHNM